MTAVTYAHHPEIGLTEPATLDEPAVIDPPAGLAALVSRYQRAYREGRGSLALEARKHVAEEAQATWVEAHTPSA